MIALASFFLVILVTLIVVRAAILALVATGLPYEIARFQARSALSGVRFTASEAETVVGHPVRRRIVLTLMLVGNAGLVTIAASLILTFAGGASTSQAMIRHGIIVALVGALLAVVRNPRLEAWITRQIMKGLGRWADLEVRDIVHLMQLTNEYAITELQVEHGDWVTGKRLVDLHLPDEGVLVLGVQRADGTYVGAPADQLSSTPTTTSSSTVDRPCSAISTSAETTSPATRDTKTLSVSNSKSSQSPATRDL